jgi:hypothetical protein
MFTWIGNSSEVLNSKWEKEMQKRLNAWPREAAGPVVMNPISRQNYNKA